MASVTFLSRGSLFNLLSRVGVPQLVAAVSNAGGLGTVLHSFIMHVDESFGAFRRLDCPNTT